MKDEGKVGGQSIDRLMTAGWGVALLKTRDRLGIYIFSPRHRRTLELELVRRTEMAFSDLRFQPPDRNVENEKNGSFSTLSIMQVTLYTMR